MQKAEQGKFVQIHYTGTLDNGDVFDSSQGRSPLEFQVGQGQVIDGFDKAVAGMSVGEKKTFNLSPDQAYGQRDETRIHTFQRAQLPPGFTPAQGDTVGLTTDQGHQIPAVVTLVTEEKVEVDWNHPLAGKSLTFAIELMGVSDQPTQASGCGCGCGGDCGTETSGGCGSGGCGDKGGCTC
ncbi:MAG: peptidylprolyl isomerase [Thermodesulfobacteriota bacterium]